MSAACAENAATAKAATSGMRTAPKYSLFISSLQSEIGQELKTQNKHTQPRHHFGLCICIEP